jgi:hypothetical protein
MDLYRDELCEKIAEYKKAKEELEEKYKEYNDFIKSGCDEFVKKISHRYHIQSDGIDINDDGFITISAVEYYSGDYSYETFFIHIYDLYDIEEALIKHKARVAEERRLADERYRKEVTEKEKQQYEKLKKIYGEI